eukprot:3941177-Rhodomonas_salina.1
MPIFAAEVLKPLMNVISKPPRWMSRADSASKQHGMMWIFGSARSKRKRAAALLPSELACMCKLQRPRRAASEHRERGKETPGTEKAWEMETCRTISATQSSERLALEHSSRLRRMVMSCDSSL